MYDLIGRDCLVDSKHIFRCIAINSFAMRPVFELYPSGPKFLLPDDIRFEPVLHDPAKENRLIITYEDAVRSIDSINDTLPSYISHSKPSTSQEKKGYLIEAYSYPDQLFFKEASYSGWSFTPHTNEADFFSTKEEAEDMLACISRGIFATYWDYDDIRPQPVVHPYTKNEV